MIVCYSDYERNTVYEESVPFTESKSLKEETTMKKLIALLSLCTIVLSACTPKVTLDFSDAENALPDALTNTIDVEVERLMAETPLPGVVLGIHKGGQPVFVKAYGDADIENGIPASADTRFYIASMTKMFTAVATMQLVEQGKLSLDDPVTKFLPEIPEASVVTVDQLLSHMADLDEAMILPNIEISTEPYSDADRVDLFKTIFATFDIEPAGVHSYTDLGMTLLSMVVERASGMSFADVVSENIAKPAGLERTQVCLTRLDGTAQGYFTAEGSLVPIDMIDLSSTGYGSASVCSTAGDMIKFMHAMRNGMLIKEDSYAQMVSVVSDHTIMPGFGYGRGMMIYPPTGDAEYVGHIGGLPGHASWAMYYPQQDMTVVIFINRLGELRDVMTLYNLHNFLLEKMAEVVPAE
ncbi:MAG: beta-lactamase family protein [Methanosarcinaceae archaeon]|nr:beta-lactamase family protein [Methanosarcinaceae archaeon]